MRALLLSLIVVASLLPPVAHAQGTRVMTIPERIDRYLQQASQTAPEPGLAAFDREDDLP
jgi:hypothetical protein